MAEKRIGDAQSPGVRVEEPGNDPTRSLPAIQPPRCAHCSEVAVAIEYVCAEHANGGGMPVPLSETAQASTTSGGPIEAGNVVREKTLYRVVQITDVKGETLAEVERIDSGGRSWTYSLALERVEQGRPTAQALDLKDAREVAMTMLVDRHAGDIYTSKAQLAEEAFDLGWEAAQRRERAPDADMDRAAWGSLVTERNAARDDAEMYQRMLWECRRDRVARDHELSALRTVAEAAKRVHEQSVKDGGYGQTLAFEDALRGLEAALFGPSDCAGKEEHACESTIENRSGGSTTTASSSVAAATSERTSDADTPPPPKSSAELPASSHASKSSEADRARVDQQTSAVATAGLEPDIQDQTGARSGGVQQPGGGGFSSAPTKPDERGPSSAVVTESLSGRSSGAPGEGATDSSRDPDLERVRHWENFGDGSPEARAESIATMLREVRTEEREACAKLCDDRIDVAEHADSTDRAASYLAFKIRARSKL